MSAALAENLPITWRSEEENGDYEAKRIARIFNGIKPGRFPRAVIEATEASHVRDAILLANELGCRVSVRSGGHSWAAWSLRDDAILIDLGGLEEMDLDEDTGIVKVSPSTTGEKLNDFLATKGLIFPGGHCPDVGLGGFLLQGGMGLNCKNWGWACEKVRGIDVVSADGEMLHCNGTENADLFWAARGAGPGFPAVVTRFYLETMKKPPVMMASSFLYPKSEYKAVMDWSLEFAPNSDSGSEIVVVGLYSSELEQDCVLSLTVTYQETETEAMAALRPINESHPPGALVEMMCIPTSLEAEYINQTINNPDNARFCSDNVYIRNDADVTAVLEQAFTTRPHPKCQTLWFCMNPCSRRELPDMALSLQSDHYFAVYTVWDDPEDDEKCKAWVKDIVEEVEEHGVGSYLGDADFQVRKTKFWSEEAGRRLMEIRRKWDPKGVICGFLDEGDKSGVDGLDNLLREKS